MRIIHLSDLHICMEHRFQNIKNVELLLSNAIKAAADHIIITGDISHLGRKEDFIIFRELLKQYNLLNPLKVSVIIGNHDIFGGVHFAEEIWNFPGSCRQIDYQDRVKNFIDSFTELFENTIMVDTSNPFPYAKIIEDHAFIGLNSIAEYSWFKNPMASNGELGNRQLDNLEELLQDSRLVDKKKVLMVHHHFGLE